MRVTVNIPEETFRKLLKLRAEKEGELERIVTIAFLIRALLEEAVQEVSDD
jgi:hypothetical protein